MRRVATPEKKTYNSIVYVNGFVTRYGNPIPMVYHVFPIAVAVVGGMPFVIAVLYIYIFIYMCVCVCVCVCVCLEMPKSKAMPDTKIHGVWLMQTVPK